MLLFIRNFAISRNIIISFNTSHVVIYRKQTMGRSLWKNVSIHLMLLFIENRLLIQQNRLSGFNTSHVVIYRCSGVKLVITTSVSIHLMLLFIDMIDNFLNMELLFQYISCCYLSEKPFQDLYIFCVSIHLMLLFIMYPRYERS